jgi:hypothetical protein
MIPLFLGLTAANLLLLGVVFVLGLGAIDGGRPTGLYAYHISLAIAAGLMTALTHVAGYMYFMATSKWLRAATDKAALNPAAYAEPAAVNKRRVLPLVMGAIVATMLAMFAGAAADPTMNAWWPGEVHLAVAAIAIGVNALGAVGEYRLIRAQGKLMDEALIEVNRTPGVVVERA